MIFVILALVAIFTVEAILTEVEHFGWATLTLIATVVVAHFLHLVNVGDLILHHTGEVLGYSAAYVGAGILWSFGKWYFFLRGFLEMYNAAKVEWNAMQLGSPVSFNGHEPLTSHLKYKYFRGEPLSKRPTATTNKKRIMAWMCFWPFSMVGTLINDPVRKFFNWIFNHFKALYQRMADRIFASTPELK